MSKIACLTLLLAGAITGLVFMAMPELDLRLAAKLRQPDVWSALRDIDPVFHFIRKMNSFVVVAIVSAAIAALLSHVIPIPPVMSKRAAMLIVATLIIGPGLFVGTFLKNVWARSRPDQIVEFGGSDPFTAWWNPAGRCLDDCSFTSSETAMAFALLAAAVTAKAQWRPAAVTLAIGFGLIVAAMRMAFGRHYPTDVIFSALLSGFTVWLLHGCLYRWAWAHRMEARLRQAMPDWRAAARPASALSRLPAR